MKRSAFLNLALLSCAAGLAAAPALAQSQAAPDGPGGISGIWFGSKFSPFRDGPPAELPRERPTEDGKAPELRPWAAKVVADRLQQYKDGHPFAKLVSVCIPDGVPSMMFVAPERPIDIIQTPGQVTILFEDLNSFRIIRLNGHHPATVTPSLMGDSVGHWEGDTLVVDTVGLNDKTSVDNLIPHSDALHLIERFRRTAEGGLDYRVTIDDPEAFIRPYTVVFPFKRVPGESIAESVCENQRNPADAHGDTGIEISTAGH